MTDPVKTIVLDGRADVNGESPAWVANFTGLEDSATYTVKEEGAPSGFTLVSTQLNSNAPVTENVSAEVTLASGDNTVIYTNKQEEEKTGSLSIQKTTTLNSVADTAGKLNGTYSFTVADQADATKTAVVNITVTNGVATAAELSSTTIADVTVNIASGVATVENLPVGTYTVTENLTAEQTGAGIALASVTLGGETKANGVQVTVQANSSESIPTAEFVNNKDTANLKLEKTVVNRTATDTSDQNFTFNVTLTAPSGVTFESSYPTVTIPNGGTAANNTQNVISGTAFTVTLKGGDIWEIDDLPKGTEYSIAEGTLPAGWTLTSPTAACAGTLDTAGATVEASFINTYGEVTQAPQATKLLKGREWQDNEEFTFILTPYGEDTTAAITAGKVVMPEAELSATANKNNQIATFGDITFKAAGTYYFTIRETQGDDTGLNYSQKEVRVKVEVTNNVGALIATMTYTDVKDDAGANAAESYDSTPKTFTNTQNPGDLELTKRVAGDGADETKQFEFTIELTAPAGGTLANSYSVVKTSATGTETTETKNLTWVVEDETPLANQKGSFTVALAKNEKITIKDLPAGTVYTITEDDYSADGYSPETTVGDLTGTITGGTTAKEEVVVTNTYEPGKLVIEKVVSGTADNSGKTFEFKVVINGNNSGNGHAGSYTIGGTTTDFNYNDGTATVTFNLENGQKAEFSVKDKKNVSFTVQENSADSNGFITTVMAEGATVNSDKTVNGSFTSNAAITVVYTNTRDKTSKEATKAWSDGSNSVNWPDDVQSVEFTLYKTVNGQKSAVTAADLTDNGFDATGFSNPITVTKDTTDNKASWPTLPTRMKVTVADDPENGIEAVPAHEEWMDITYTVEETRVTYTTDSGKPELVGTEAIEAAYNPTLWTAENKTITNKVPGSVQVTKTFSGIETDLIPSGFQIVASWSTDGGTTISTRTLKITGMESYPDVTMTGTGPYTWTINGLPIGTEVTFTESGYGIAGYNVTSTVAVNGGENTNGVTGKTSAATEPGTVAFENTYTPGVELPSTGGPGTILYTTAGLGLMALAILALLLKRRKEQMN